MKFFSILSRTFALSCLVLVVVCCCTSSVTAGDVVSVGPSEHNSHAISEIHSDADEGVLDRHISNRRLPAHTVSSKRPKKKKESKSSKSFQRLEKKSSTSTKKSTKKSSKKKGTSIPSSIAPTNSPVVTPTRAPDMANSPSPEISPTTSPTASPTDPAVLPVLASPFSLVYVGVFVQVPTKEDFAQVADVTHLFLEEFMEDEYEDDLFVFTTTLTRELFEVGEPARANYRSTGLFDPEEAPSPRDLDQVMDEAFQDDNLEEYLSRIQDLPSSNVLSMTTEVTKEEAILAI